MKKFLSIMVLSSTFISTIAPLPANAIFIFNHSSYEDAQENGGGTDWGVFCIFLLPLCVLKTNSDTKHSGVVTVDYLTDNGYRPNEIKAIIKDQSEISRALVKSKKILKIGKEDTRESLARDLKQLNPAISETYISFFLEMNAVK